MKWHDRMNRALEYIEGHLADDIDMELATQQAGQTVAGYQRAFSDAAGMPVSEYIRRRRLHLAAAELKGGGPKVIDVAMKYGYDSPDAFSRAFRDVYGVTPSAVRKDAPALEPFPRISFYMSLTGSIAMNTLSDNREIVNMYYERMPAARLVGRRYTSADLDEDFMFGRVWGEWFANDWFNFLWQQGEQGALPGQEGAAFFAREWQKGSRAYWIGVMKPEGTPVPEGFACVDFPAGVVGVCWERGSTEDPAFLRDTAHFKVLDHLLAQGNEAHTEISGDGIYWTFERYDEGRYFTRDGDGKVVVDRLVYLRETPAIEQAMQRRRKAEEAQRLEAEAAPAPQTGAMGQDIPPHAPPQPENCIENMPPFCAGGEETALFSALATIFCSLESSTIAPHLCYKDDTPCTNCGECGDVPLPHRQQLAMYQFLVTVTGVALMPRDYNDCSCYALKTIPGVLPHLLEDRLDMAMAAQGLGYWCPGKEQGEDGLFKLIANNLQQDKPVLLKLGEGRGWCVITGCRENGRILFGVDVNAGGVDVPRFAAYRADELLAFTDWFIRLRRVVVITGKREKTGFRALVERMIAQLETPSGGIYTGMAQMLDTLNGENAFGVAYYLKTFADYMMQGHWHASECFGSTLRRMAKDPAAQEVLRQCARQCLAVHNLCWDIWRQLGVGPHTRYALPNLIGKWMLEKDRQNALKDLFSRVWKSDAALQGLLREVLT